jgi:hypothetical protein
MRPVTQNEFVSRTWKTRGRVTKTRPEANGAAV